MGEYIDHQARSGVFSDDALSPECDPRVMCEFYKRLRAAFPDEPESEIILLQGKYGFTRDYIDDERRGLNWAGSTPLVDLDIGASFAEFAADLPSLQASDIILTDTFSFQDGFGNLSTPIKNIVRLHSPVAKIDTGFDAYLESLTTERRKKYRRMVSDFERTPLRFEVSNTPLATYELDFVRSNLEKKWGEAAGYAYRQTLWSVAVQKYRPQQSLICRVYDGNDLVFIQTMIVKGRRVICQSITKNEDRFFSGLAAMTDFECIKALCGKYDVFDPSCRTGIDDPESIGIAKRATVNMDCIKPLLVLGAGDIDESIIQGKEA